MNIRPSFLKTFLAVARTRNITRAAEDVHLAQSSVSDQIQLLESELGASLFTRAKTRLELTPAGEALKPYAEEILALMHEARAAVETAAAQPPKRLTIGALETIASVKSPPWLAAFQAAHPNVAIQMKIAGSGMLMQKLSSGDIDIACCFDKGSHDERFVKRCISMEPLALVASPGEPREPLGIDLKGLAVRRFVATEVGCIYRHLFDKAFSEAGIAAPRLAAEVDSIRTIVRLVETGTGLALVPRFAVADRLDSGKLIEMPWPGPVQAASLVAIWRRRRTQPTVVRQFLASANAAWTPIKPGDAHPRHAVSPLS